MKHRKYSTTAIACGAFLFCFLHGPAQSQVWQEPSDPAMAINRPDEYAWRLFIALNWPADASGCRSDPQKKLGDPGMTVWESWRSRTETYLPGGKKPPEWGVGCSQQLSAGIKVLAPSSQAAAANSAVPKPAFTHPLPGEALSSQLSEEVRLNKASYDFIRDEGLYARNEQTARARMALEARKNGQPLPEKAVISFPVGAKEAKGHWALIRDEDKSRYHWASGKFKDRDVTYGLVAFSFTTKDLPNWFWATFEHVDNEVDWPELKKRWPSQIESDAALVAELNQATRDWFAGWEVKSVDKFSCKTPPHNCNDFPKGLGIEGNKWQYYRLRGTQTEFVDAKGAPTRLVNSKIEGIFEQRHMSCITCHALAAVNSDGSDMPIAILERRGPTRKDKIGFIGAPKTELFKDNILQLDFVWSLRMASCDPTDERPCEGSQ